jgi:hypothetical protein
MAMTDDEIDQAWSRSVASIAAITLIHAKLLNAVDQDRATAIIAEEVLVRPIIGDRPDRENWKYKSA